MSTAELPPSQSTVQEFAGERRRWLFPLCVAVLLIVHAALAIGAARRLSVTHDEYWHLPVGLLTWQAGRFDFDNINPPLARLWSALPLAIGRTSAGDTENAHDAFAYGDAFLRAHPADYDAQFLAGRVMTVLLSVVTGIWLAVWSRQMFGTLGALCTVALWAFCPNLLANASLVTPDAGLTCAFVATLHAAWLFAQKPTWGRALWLGACLGIAQLIKFTAILLLPLALIAWVCVRWFAKPGESSPTVSVGKRIALWVTLLLSSLLILNAGYLFRGSGATVGSYQFVSRSLASLNTAPAWIRFLPLPLPRDFMVGLDRQRQIMEGQHPVYLDGEWRTGGFPLYFVMALAYKTPHAVQVLVLLMAIAWYARARSNESVRVAILSLISIGLLLLVASTSGMQLGLRYILPVFPLLYLLAGILPSWIAKLRRNTKLAGVVVVTALLALPFSARVHPEYLAYFNELSGGVVEGRRHLLDSNLDWGQDLRALRDHVQTQNYGKIGLAYFGMIPPAEYGLNFELPPSFEPRPGRFAISVNFVQGRPHTIRDPQGRIRSAGLDQFGYFRFFTPKVRIGASIDLYEISLDDVQRFYVERQRLLR